jgi:hypothetical protein
MINYNYCFSEKKLCLRKFILFLFFSLFVSEETPLHKSASGKGDLEVCRLLLQRNADVEAKDCQ